MTNEQEIKLQEYNAIVSLYDTALNVGYQRFLSYFAVHAALLVGLFTAEGSWTRISLSAVGIAFSILTVLTMEHFRQILLLRTAQGIRAEKEINELCENSFLAVFEETRQLLGKKDRIHIKDTRGHTVSELPSGILGRFMQGKGAVMVEQLATWLIFIFWSGALASQLFP